MSIRRRLIHGINRPFQQFTGRLRRIAVAARKLGQTLGARKIAEDLRLETLRLSGKERRRHWRRWYKANKTHQRRLRALRQMGVNTLGTPHSLKLEWVE